MQSRTLVQSQWYSWRHSLLLPLAEVLKTVMEKLNADIQSLEHAFVELGTISSTLNVEKISLLNQVSSLEEKFAILLHFDWERYEQLTKSIAQADHLVEERTKDLEDIKKRHASLQTELAAMQHKKELLVQKIDIFSKELDDLSEISKLDADLAKGMGFFFLSHSKL